MGAPSNGVADSESNAGWNQSASTDGLWGTRQGHMHQESVGTLVEDGGLPPADVSRLHLGVDGPCEADQAPKRYRESESDFCEQASKKEQRSANQQEKRNSRSDTVLGLVRPSQPGLKWDGKSWSGSRCDARLFSRLPSHPPIAFGGIQRARISFRQGIILYWTKPKPRPTLSLTPLHPGHRHPPSPTPSLRPH